MQDNLADGPPTTPTPNITPNGPTFVTSDTTITSGQIVYSDQNNGLILDAAPVGGPYPSLTNDGLVVVSGTGPITALIVDGGGAILSPTITNAASGALYAEALTGNALGCVELGEGPDLLNQGLIQVVSLMGNAQGLQGSGEHLDFTNAAGATLTVWAADQAIGATMVWPGTFTNAGVLDVTGASAIGFMGSANFNNSGTITTVSLDPSHPSIGVDVIGLEAGSYTNSGAISGDYSFFIDPTGGSSPSTILNADLINSGTMSGTISLGQGVNEIDNTGTITGDIDFGNGPSTYDGANGHLVGAIHLGHATNTVTLGGDNEVVYGGGGSDTITGGAGNDFIEIARGSNAVDGGGGFNTVSFADSDTAVVLDLGAGLASGAGTTTLENIQEVIGTNFDDTLKAGSTAATLVAGSGRSTLIGGAGNDTLVAGTGGDTMTGGGGNNAFLYSTGDHQLVIPDFGGAGDHDTLEIFGYASASSVTQQGADTLISLSSTDSILLENVQAASLTTADVVYSAAAYVPPPEPGSLPVFGSTPIDFTNDLTVFAPETFNIVGQPWGLLDDGATNTMHTLDNFGTIVVTGMTGDLIGIEGGGGLGGAIINEADASVIVSNGGGSADGVGGAPPPLTNAGLLSVTAPGQAIGVDIDVYGNKTTNQASGTIDVTSTGADAYGLRYGNEGGLENDGTITVTAAAQAVGFYAGRFEFESIVNDGVIAAASTGGFSFGILVGGLDGGANTDFITNAGTITAQTAISSFEGGFGPPNAPSLTVTNTGTINGDIVLGGSESSLTNTGVIDGNILLRDDTGFSFLGAADTIDLRGGTFTGYIALSPGLAGDQAIQDTIWTGDNATLIKVAGLESKLSLTIHGSTQGTAALQLDVALDFASAAHNADGSWTVTSLADGVETLYNVQKVQFADGEAFFVAPGGMNLAGGPGLNTAIFSGSLGEYSLAESAGVITVADSAPGRDGTSTLTGVQQAEFTDVTVVFDLHSYQDLLVYELYQAAYDRTPDNAGFRFWAGVADNTQASALWLADAFLAAPEFTQVYGSNPTNQQYVTELYAHVLDRAPDQAGLDYWVGKANAGEARDQLLLDFATSAENVALIGPHTATGYWTLHE